MVIRVLINIKKLTYNIMITSIRSKRFQKICYTVCIDLYMAAWKI